MNKRIDICLFSVLVALTLYAAFVNLATVLGLAVSFAAYFTDKYVSLKPKHEKDIIYYEEKLRKMEVKIDKISMKLGFGN